ncbi:radical SAM protein [Streptomyces sp. NPDC020719]|uniref:radical SAM protein n=1 Tax=Streptomyces sp. NPDC020719 TaxID=3154896 RepID=UPI0033EBAB74
MTNLGIPTVPRARVRDVGGGVEFSNAGHHFQAAAGLDVAAAAAAATVPLSVILQVTKRCDFGCSFCSEIDLKPDPELDALDTMRANLQGVSRVFLSGGEPLIRKDFGDIVDMYYKDFILAVPTNATNAHLHAKRIAGKIAFANIGFEGPRSTFQRVRGDYDKAMAGVRALQGEGIPLALSCVVYRSTLASLPCNVQIADVLGAGKVKLIMPLRKGNSLKLAQQEFIKDAAAEEAFSHLARLRTEHAWTPALRLTTWTPENEGHMIVIEPDGLAQAWPVYDAPDLWKELGNVLEEPISEIWKRYPYKVNHFSKYLGRSIRTVEQGV